MLGISWVFTLGSCRQHQGLPRLRKLTECLKTVEVMSVHYTNDSCPFSHRAMFARCLRPPESGKVQYVPYGRQVEFAERLGVEAIQGARCFEGKTVQEIQKIRQDYLSVNPSGEVPSLVTAQGALITESEILAEYFDLSSVASEHRLVPSDPVQASRVRLCMKKFNEVVPGLFALLRNQDPAKDHECADKIRSSMHKFRSTLDEGDSFCVGAAVSLADVHCGPFLYRLSVALQHFRDFDLLEDRRIKSLLTSIKALPEFQSGSCSEEEVIANYEFVANGSQWGKDGKSFAGRGRSRFPWILHYFPVRGRAEALRMLLRATQQPYVDRLYTEEEWKVMKSQMPEGKGVPGVATRPVGNRGLPVLQLPDGTMIPETADIARFICEKRPDLFPAEQAAEAYEMTLAVNTYPLLFPQCMLASYPAEVTEAILRGELPETYHGNLKDLPPYGEVLQVFLHWEQRLGDQAFFGGAAPHFGEFFLFAALDALRQTDPSTAAKVGRLQAWYDRMGRLPAVEGYLQARPPMGPEAHGKPGSLIRKYQQPSVRSSSGYAG